MYEYETKFTGRCDHHQSNITACQRPGTNFEIDNQRFTMNYRKCPEVSDSYDYRKCEMRVIFVYFVCQYYSVGGYCMLNQN